MTQSNRHLTRRQFQSALAGGIGALAAWPASQALAQEGKPIKLIIPFATGGSNDIVGRVLAQQLSIRLKRSVVVDNVLGGGGSIGAANAARAEPDGNTLLLISSTFTMNSAVMKLPFDPVKSFTPIAMLGMGPSVVVANSAVPANTMKELVEYSKKNKGVVNFSTSGAASFQHFAVELMKTKTGADITLIHYKGGGPALNDVAAGHVQATLGSYIQMQPMLQAGKVKLPGVASAKRIDLIPDVPTLKEGGIDVEVGNWWGLLAPANTPTALVESLNKEVNAVLTSPDIKKRLAGEGADPTPMSRADFARLMADETQRWAAVAKQTSIKVD